MENISRLVVRGTQAGKVRSKNGLQVTMTRAFLVDLFFHNYRYLKNFASFEVHPLTADFDRVTRNIFCRTASSRGLTCFSSGCELAKVVGGEVAMERTFLKS